MASKKEKHTKRVSPFFRDIFLRKHEHFYVCRRHCSFILNLKEVCNNRNCFTREANNNSVLMLHIIGLLKNFIIIV